MVKFISYKGKKPKLCLGQLKVEIDDETVTFGPDDSNSKYPLFWKTGGFCTYDYKGDKPAIFTGDWKFDVNRIPNKYQQYAEELCKVFRENVQVGCCGGCSKP